MTGAALVLLIAALWLAALVAWRWSALQAAQAELHCLRLGFNRSISRADIESFVSALVGLRPPWWKRWFEAPTVVFEVTSSARGIEHHMLVADRHRPRVEAALRTHLPSLRFEDVDVTQLSVSRACEYRLSDPQRVLRVDDALAPSLLGSTTGLTGDESVTLQWQLTPGRPPATPHVVDSEHRPTLVDWRRGQFLTTADASAAIEKLSTPLFMTVLRIGVQSDSPGRDIGLLRHVEAPLHTTSAPGVHLTRRWLPKTWIAARVRQRAVPPTWPIPLNAAELSGLIGWPFGPVSVTGLALSGCRQLPLSAAVPTEGTVIGDGFTAGQPRAAAMDLPARTRHVTIVGATGTGKTALMTSLVLDDISNGHGVVVVDPKGSDLVDGVLERLEPDYHDRIAVLDLADHDRPVGFNPLHQDGLHPELAVEHLVGTMRRIWSQSWGQRTDDLLRMALRTLALDSEATVADMVPLLTDPVFRRPFVERVTEPALEQFWRQYGALSDGEASQWYAPVTNKLRAIVARPSVRRIMAQPQPALNIAQHINAGGVLLVPLNAGRVGEEAAALFGALLLGQVWNVIQQRSREGGAHRPLMVHLDEIGRYAHLPVPLEELLSQARSYGVGVSLAFQHLAQLTPELRHAVLSNPRSRIAFQVGATDARVLATEFGQRLTSDDLQGLDPFEVVAQIHAAGRTQPAATLTTRPPAPIRCDAQIVRAQSRQHWGADGDAIDAAIAERHARLTAARATSPSTPTGRKRRQS